MTSSQPEAQQSWAGQLTKITKKDGDGWTRFTMHTDEPGVTFSTFDKDLATAAYSLLNTTVEVRWTDKGKYGREAVSVEPVE